MYTLVTGVGYTGRRILPLLPDDAVVGISRSPIAAERPVRVFDLDRPGGLPVELRQEYAVIYTVPPGSGTPDSRLRRFLPLLTPAPARWLNRPTCPTCGRSAWSITR